MLTKKTNTNLIKVVNILNDGNFHDGDEIGVKLGITRSAVWKTIKKLGKYQVDINAIKGKGYALAEPLFLLDSKKIKQGLNSELKKSIDLILFESVDSTSEYLKKNPNKNLIKVCLAEQLTKARGRFARSWYAPFGQNIYFSCRYHFQKDLSELAGLSLVMGLAVVKTLNEYGIKNNISIKWPNDVLWQGSKLAGILIEVSAEAHNRCDAIIGIGLNVNMLAVDDNVVSQSWASMRKILGQAFDRNQVTAALINHLINYLQQFAVHGLSYFIDEWKSYDHLAGQAITLLSGVNEFHGKGAGISAQGHLLLKAADGKIHPFSSGDATIKK